MNVTRMRRGWRITLTDNEFELLRITVEHGLGVASWFEERLPYKVRKVLRSERWIDPLHVDEDRRADETGTVQIEPSQGGL